MTITNRNVDKPLLLITRVSRNRELPKNLNCSRSRELNCICFMTSYRFKIPSLILPIFPDFNCFSWKFPKIGKKWIFSRFRLILGSFINFQAKLRPKLTWFKQWFNRKWQFLGNWAPFWTPSCFFKTLSNANSL